MDILTRIQKKLLPHISRIFSALDNPSQFRFVVLALFLAFVALNVWVQHVYPNTLILERTNLLSSPFSSSNHIVFGKELYAKGNVPAAVAELMLANQITMLPSPFSLLVPSVLGAQSEPSDLLRSWEQSRTYGERAYHYWKAVVVQKPDYRDAYIMLSVLCRKLDKQEESIAYLKAAYVIDPNNTIVKDLAAQFGLVL